MRDNSLQINFEYQYPGTAVLLVYETYGGGMFFGDSARIQIRKTLIGEDAVKMYSALTGKDIPSIHKEAGCSVGEGDE